MRTHVARFFGKQLAAAATLVGLAVLENEMGGVHAGGVVADVRSLFTRFGCTLAILHFCGNVHLILDRVVSHLLIGTFFGRCEVGGETPC